MFVSISALTFDIAGNVRIGAVGDDSESVTSRRVNRAATLDGGVVISDAGYAPGDRNLFYSWKPDSKAANDALARLVRLYSLLRVSTKDGVYIAAPQAFTPGVTESTISLYVKEEYI